MRNREHLKSWRKDWYSKNKKRVKEYQKEYRAHNKFEKYRKIKEKYGLSKEDYEYLLEIQDYCCAICKKEKDLCIDHCHQTGRIRGLLCRRCNSVLGQFDNKDLYKATMEYLNG
jgi:hypothetical protein